MKFLSIFFEVPSREKKQAAELAEAELDLLKYEANVEYAMAMRDMLRQRVARLSQTTKEI